MVLHKNELGSREAYRKKIAIFKEIGSVRKVCNENDIDYSQVYRFMKGENTISPSNLRILVEGMDKEIEKVNENVKEYLKKKE